MSTATPPKVHRFVLPVVKGSLVTNPELVLWTESREIALAGIARGVAVRIIGNDRRSRARNAALVLCDERFAHMFEGHSVNDILALH